MLDQVLSTELARFRMVIVFTTPRHFVRSHASIFTSPFFILFFTCFFHVCFGLSLPVLPLTSNFKAFTITFSSFFSKHDRTTAYYLLKPSYLKTPLCPTCPSTPRCFFDLIVSPHTSLKLSLFLFFSKLPSLFLSSTMLHFHTRYNLADLKQLL